jgi:hypothetical protein
LPFLAVPLPLNVPIFELFWFRHFSVIFPFPSRLVFFPLYYRSKLLYSRRRACES